MISVIHKSYSTFKCRSVRQTADEGQLGPEVKTPPEIANVHDLGKGVHTLRVPGPGVPEILLVFSSAKMPNHVIRSITRLTILR